MRVIAVKRVKGWIQQHPKAKNALLRWMRTIKAAKWTGFADARKTLGTTIDESCDVASKRRVTIFDICGNDYRLIAAVHYDGQRVYAMRFMTHAEYSKNQWKDQL